MTSQAFFSAVAARAGRVGLICAAALLSACSGMRMIDSDVTSFSRWPTGGASGAPGTTYRFERLPSQEALRPVGASEISQEQLEAAAAQALDKLGLVQRPDAAVLVAQVGMTSVQQPGGYGAGGLYGGTGVSVGTGNVGSFIGLSFPVMRYDPPLYLREVSLILRDSRSNAVVYEARARHSGPWSDGRVVFPAMLQAALNGFPNPPQGARRVNVEIPR